MIERDEAIAGINAAFRQAIRKINADGSERAVENVKALLELLESARNEGVPQEWIDALQEDIGREVSPEIQRASCSSLATKVGRQLRILPHACEG
jgi:hypothetical protein